MEKKKVGPPEKRQAKEMEEKHCSHTGCNGVIIAHHPTGFGQMPKEVCSNPGCPGKQRHGGFGN